MNRLPADIHWRWLGRQPYQPVLERQRALRRDVLAGRAGPTLLLVEHDPVITLGRRGSLDDLAVSPGFLSARGVEVVPVERGGLATYHGPGQLVGYPIVPVARLGYTVPEFVHALEGVLIAFLRDRGVSAARREAYPGVWCGAAKLAAIGLHLHRGVSMHGFALNLCPDLSHYTWIVPCGIHPEQGTVSSLEALTGERLIPAEAAPEIARRLVQVWNRR